MDLEFFPLRLGSRHNDFSLMTLVRVKFEFAGGHPENFRKYQISSYNFAECVYGLGKFWSDN